MVLLGKVYNLAMICLGMRDSGHIWYSGLVAMVAFIFRESISPLVTLARSFCAIHTSGKNAQAFVTRHVVVATARTRGRILCKHTRSHPFGRTVPHLIVDTPKSKTDVVRLEVIETMCELSMMYS